MRQSHTPDTVSIRPRLPRFNLEQALATNWHSNDPFKTAFFNALSLTFPIGEKYFIDSVRAFEAEVTDAKLSSEVRGFIGQEATHRREHRHYNAVMCASRGVDDRAYQADLQARIDARDEVSRYSRLLETVTFEHLTAILAHGFLTDPNWLDGADPAMREIWTWHAIEEAEHKAVTFDVYRAAGGDMERLRLALPYVTRQLLKDVFAGMWLMLKADRQHLNPLVWTRGLNWLFGRKGVLRVMYAGWNDFRREDFHPWDHDNRSLIDTWKANGEPELLVVPA